MTMDPTGVASGEHTGPGQLPASLASYLGNGAERVQGWLSPTTAFFLAHLLSEQVRAGLRGDVCEIGVHHGKLFLVLANAVTAGEQAVAVDVFSDQHKNTDQSGNGDRAVFERHLAVYAPRSRVEIVQESSLDLERLGFLSRRFRFMSIDGGHTASTVTNDLHLAQQTLVGDGVAALDDILSSHWTGVLTGLAAYVAGGGTLVPFALVPNKLLLTTGEAAAGRCRSMFRRFFPLALAKNGIEFLNGTVDTYEDHPRYAGHHRAGEDAVPDAGARDRDTLELQLAETRQEAADLRDTNERITARLALAEAHLEKMQASTSWRITGPLRRVVAFARRGQGTGP